MIDEKSDDIEAEKPMIKRSKSYERFREIGRNLSARQKNLKKKVVN